MDDELEELLDGAVSDHYSHEMVKYVQSLPLEVRGKYTMQTIAAIKQECTAKQFMWLSSDEKLRLVKYGFGSVEPEQDWED